MPACALALLITPAAGFVDAQAAPIDGIHNIQHVVMIMQENRSFDTYFGTYPGANGIPAHVCVPDPVYGGCVKPFHDPNYKNFGGPHGVRSALGDINGGKMDGFIAENEGGTACSGTNPSCRPCEMVKVEGQSSCHDVMGYHDAREIPNYWTYAQNYVLQDNLYESALSWSLPEHLFLVSGWSAACPFGDTNPMDCQATLSPPHQGPSVESTNAWTDITYLLDKGHVSWRYFVFEGAEPDCQSDEAVTCKPVIQGPETPGIWNPLPTFTDVKTDGQLSNVQSLSSFYQAVHEPGSCGLPNVSWINPNQSVSEHPPSPISKGQTYVTTIVNQIMKSPCWPSTAIFISWDDWGGFYDHVVPPEVDQNGYGLRVPGLVISPYAKSGFIDHQQLSHDAYLKFIEDVFLEKARLNPLTDGRPDPRPSVREEAPGLGELANDFNFNQTPRAPLLLEVHPKPGPASKPPEPIPPSTETGTASFITQTHATLNASVNPNEAAVSDCHFEYGPSTFYGQRLPCGRLPGSGGTPVAVSATVSALTANSSYHFRIVATNESGTSYGADRTLTTLPNPPSVVTGAATLVKPTSAQLNATVNPNGATVSGCHFEYGTSSSYGSSVPCSSAPGSASTPVAVSAAISALSTNSTYHFRILATNPGGTSSGSDRTFVAK